MKKNRKNYGPYYTEGRNYFGERCKTKRIVLKKETAQSQMLEAVKKVMRGSNIEYTFDMTCFSDSPAELEKLMDEVNVYMGILATQNKKPFYSSYNLPY